MTASLKDHDHQTLSREAVLTIGVLVVSTFTVILNEMLMGVAMPRIMVDLSITASTAQWLTTAYMLTMAVVIPATGFLTERYQMRTVFTLAMALFAVGTLVAIVAPGFETLLVGRVIQAVGTSIVIPLSYTAMSTLVPESRRGSVMAMNIVATSAAPALGPLFSGVILSRFDWPWLFIAILPLALATLVLGYATIRVRSVARKVALDALSLVLSGVGFASLVYGLASLGEGGGHTVVSPWTSLLLGVVVVAAFVARQVHLQKFDRAQLDMRPFTVRTFSVAAFIMLCFMIACYGMMTLMPVILQTSYGLSTVQAGLFMVPGGVTIAIVSAVVGRLYDRIGPRPLVITGAVIDAAGLYALSTLAPGTAIELLLVTYLFIIVGQALMWTPLFAASLGVLNAHLLPHGSAIVNTLQQLAGAAGIAIMFSIMGMASRFYQDGGEAVGPAMAHGAQQAYLVGCGFVLVSLLAALLLPKRAADNGVALPAH
ncbi:DHA2 family efflux MFS transporter permease subunit [Agrobacterium rubi]|uniref:Multidrug efflux MFS transporter n=1 Tax=Agrobacterium rubi TaxID=28099 RepID=A0AAE7R9W7_9HYPH|nr:DHA2 family efflux MFS transporter permease subunit [Agrobacterium rubi]NTE87774.1 multidrug efflux MFS transporter [Agrobacterium rubi]NTF05227.1 multidrug efflux MFS transporter [Agrobacterium rubi]NTF37868.1 multidrug efflux MFS transporter [Agrobacterium rubi]OCJ54124.1 MFS transporter [Agrobacterium rubi]QTG01732.1 multidrug efflux MFS transporter [Agrobacterium rubi]